MNLFGARSLGSASVALWPSTPWLSMGLGYVLSHRLGLLRASSTGPPFARPCQGHAARRQQRVILAVPDSVVTSPWPSAMPCCAQVLALCGAAAWSDPPAHVQFLTVLSECLRYGTARSFLAANGRGGDEPRGCHATDLGQAGLGRSDRSVVARKA